MVSSAGKQRAKSPVAAAPPPLTAATMSNNPRRAPANKSVSLVHSKRKISPTSNPKSDENISPSDSQRQNTSDGANSPSSLQRGKESSGESSNAEKWFEKSNNDVRDHSTSFANDSPYFMRNSSNSTSPEDKGAGAAEVPQTGDGSSSLPWRTGMMRIGTDGSSTEEYRGVIDDLTIENKKLKRRLRRYEKFHDAHLKKEKLFELRIHGLPPAKKHELEETLRNFAASLNNTFPADGYEGLVPALKGPSSHASIQNRGSSSHTSLQNKGPSSQASAQNNADSTYASASGQGSSGLDSSELGQSGQTLAARRQNIHSYLHHIPEGLMPQQTSINMSDSAKKQLVVSRLEDLFTGKGATSGRHQHPLQQQKVSQRAAREERNTAESLGQRTAKEGSREAHIMPRPVEGRDQSLLATEKHQQDPTVPSPNSQQERTEQRPTRPLDLDPFRAQVAAENFEYIRHLGFSPPDPHSEGPLEDDHGWIYLNLLINMAQLHTINVTAEFVRKALTDGSTKFQVSGNGRKVRWVGERASTASSQQGLSVRLSDSGSGESPKKRPKLVGRYSGRSASSGNSRNKDKLQYTPLFFHRENTDDTDDDSSDDDDGSSVSPHPAALNGDSTGMTSSGNYTVGHGIPAKKRKVHDDGPMIFYKSAGFITDLSGEHSIDGISHAPRYDTTVVRPIGLPPPAQQVQPEKRGPLHSSKDLPEPMDLTDNPIPASMEVAFPLDMAPQSDSEASTPLSMEVTGIGGVWPADNFSISVKSRHAPAKDQTAGASRSAAGSTSIVPPRLASILKGSGLRHMPKRELQVVSSHRKDLPPSELPPALLFTPAEGSDDESGDDEEDDPMTWEPHISHLTPPSAAPQPVELSYDSSDNEDGEDPEADQDDDGDSDDSVDMLATAREVDPEAIRAKEREYDANMADRLAEEIPAGSSAATAGGGSGYASPAGSSDDPEEHRIATRNARMKAANMRPPPRGPETTHERDARRQSSSEDADEEDASMDEGDGRSDVGS